MSKLSEFWKKIGISVAILIACGIAGALLLIIVYCIPTDTIKKNITSGSEVLLIESAEFEYAPGYKSAILDNNTDALMLSIAAFPSDQPIRDAMLAPHYAYEKSRENVASLWGLLNDNTAEKKWRSDYGRYWPGYLVVLKPILTIFDFSDLRIANQILQLILFVLVLLEVAKKHRDYLPAFIALMIFWNPATMGVSLQYAACYYVTMVGILLVEKFSMANDFQFGILFMIMGACTSYLDFLTFPIATLGIPLLFWLLNRYEAQKHTKFFQTMLLAIFWTIGYIGMWAEKWVIGTVLTGDNIIKDALFNVGSRTSTIVEGESVSRLNVLVSAIRMSMLKWPYVILAFGFVIWAFWKYRGMRWNKELMPFLYTSILPLIWIILVPNHTYIHPRLTYRILGITIFAVLCILIAMGQNFKRDKR